MIFVVKKSTISKIIKKLLHDIFAEYNRTNPFKSFTVKFNLGELPVNGISAKFTAESTKKYITVM